MTKIQKRRVFLAAWFLVPVTVLFLCALSWVFLVAYVCLWLASRAYLYFNERRLTRSGIFTSRRLYRKHRVDTEAFLVRIGEPAFFDPKDLPWAPGVEESFSEIRKEVLDYIAKNDEQFVDAFNNRTMATSTAWKARSILGWGLLTSSDLPKTLAVMQQIGAMTCNVSRLAPESDIRIHPGDSNAYVRCHLPLVVPAPLPQAGLEVGGEQRSWVEGRIMAFNDLRLHRAFNHTQHERVVLIFDVMRAEFERHSASVRCYWLVLYTMMVIEEARAALSLRKRRATRLWDSLFKLLIEPPMKFVLCLYFRFFCVRLPFWFRIFKDTGFYF
jgi:beta-hydroxylase